MAKSKNLSNRIKVDGEKLKNQFLRRNLKPAIVAAELGHDPSMFAKYWTNSATRGSTIGIVEANYLEKVYGIKRSSYELKAKEEHIIADDDNEIYRCVYKAVTFALNDFFNNKQIEEGDVS